MTARKPRPFILVMLIALQACATYPEADFAPGSVAQSVPDTPFYPQDRYQCGPAALLTVLQHSGASTSMAALVDAVYLPDRQGSLQLELVAAARRAGRIPYTVDPTLDALAAELAAGRPVIVLQNLGPGWAPRWHYAVVFAVDPDARVIRLRSGTDPVRETDAAVFLRTWARSGFWGLVVLRPGELPERPDPGRFLEALVGMDATGNAHLALPSWRAAHELWPTLGLPLFALGNAALAAGDAASAEASFRRLLVLDPQHAAARNNLAHALAAQGRRAAAIAELEDALRQPGLPPPLRTELQDSLTGIRARHVEGT